MKSKGIKELKGNSVNADGEKEFLKWIPLNEIGKVNIKPSFLKEKKHDIIEGKNILHIVTDIDK